MFQFDSTITIPFLLSAATILFTFLRTRRSDVDDRFKAGSKRIADLELRVQTVEQTLSSMPDKDDMHGLQLTLVEMNGEMKAVRATMRSMAETQARIESVLGRHEDHLLDKSK